MLKTGFDSLRMASLSGICSQTSAVTQTEIAHLTEEVKQHNNFARRMPVVEEQIRELSKRIEDLERSREHDER